MVKATISQLLADRAVATNFSSMSKDTTGDSNLVLQRRKTHFWLSPSERMDPDKGGTSIKRIYTEPIDWIRSATGHRCFLNSHRETLRASIPDTDSHHIKLLERGKKQ